MMDEQKQQEEAQREHPEVKVKRKVGAPPGNQNARTHGFYSKVLTEQERLSLAQAVDVDGLDSEIALLRVKIKSLVENDPENLDLIVRAVNTLTKMVSTRTAIDLRSRGEKQEQVSLKQAVLDVLKDVALPVGLGIANSLKNKR